jgi:hypothetical protein
VIKRTRRRDGSWELRRPKYDEKIYRVSQTELDTLRDLRMSYDSAKNSQDGYLRSWTELERFERAGRRWVLLQEPSYEYAVEMELTADGDIGEVVAVPPEKAYELAKRRDLPHVIQE